MIANHYKILSSPPNETYIDAFLPRIRGNYIYWFDDNERERAARCDDFSFAEDGAAHFYNPDKAEQSTFIPADSEQANTTRSLLKLCPPPAPGKAFFRPYLCKGELSRVKAFIVGYNPATPIFPSDQLTLSKYVLLLQDYEALMDFLEDYRAAESQGAGRKTRLSKTRPNIIWCRRWMERCIGGAVMETNINAYPTPKAVLLRNEPEGIIEKGRAVFIHTLLQYTPELLVVHGMETLKEFATLVHRSGLTATKPVIPKSIAQVLQMQNAGPVITMDYGNNKTGKVFACRHLWQRNMYLPEFDLFRKMVASHI